MLRKFTLIIFIFLQFFSYAEVVTVTKPGGLEKTIKKLKLVNPSDLTIRGEINMKDIINLSKFPSLKSLNFEEVIIKQENKKEVINEFIFPSLPNLETLKISETFGGGKRIDLTNIPNLKNLSTSTTVLFDNILPEILDFLELSGEPGINFKRIIKTKKLKVPNKEWINKQNALYKIQCNILETEKDGPDNLVLYSYDPNYPEFLEVCTELTAISLNKYPDSYFILPASITSIDKNAFSYSKIKTIEFPNSYSASQMDDGLILPSSITVIIPRGGYNQYRKKILSPIYEKERTHTFVYSPEKDGSLDAFLANDKLNHVDTLKIVGKIPVNFNFKSLKNAENLRFIDLTQADIEMDPNTFKDEELKYVKKAVDKILYSFYDKVEEIEGKYYNQVALLGLFGYLTGETAKMNKMEANGGDIVAAIKSEFYSALNEDLTEEYNKAKNSYPNEKIKKEHDEMLSSLKSIGAFTDQVPSALDEFVFIKSQDWISLSPEQSKEIIHNLEAMRGTNFSKDEIHSIKFMDMLSSIDPNYEYARVWSNKNPGEFFLQRKRKKHILTPEERSQIIFDLKLKVNKLSKKKKMPETFSEIPNLLAVILKKNTPVDSNTSEYSIEFK